MEYVWFLLIILKVGHTADQERVPIMGSVPYTSEEECIHHGNNTVAWLSQDFVAPEFHCIPQLQKAEVGQNG